jgi:hypothetical protein
LARVKYDLSNAVPQDNAPVPPGLYTVVIEEIVAGDSKSSGAPMLTATFKITKGDHKGRKFWYYIMLDGSTDGRFREFVDALGLKAKGDLDTDNIKGMVCQVKTSIEKGTDGYDDKGRVKNVLPADGTAGSDDDEEDDLPPYPEWEQAELAEEVEARNITMTAKKTKAALIRALEADDAANSSEEEDEEEEDEDDEEGLTLAELEEMDRAALKALIKENELDIKVLKSTTDEALRESIAEALEIGSDDEEEEEEEEGEDEVDLSGMTRAELRVYAKENALDVKFVKSKSDDKLREEIAAALGSEEEEEEEEEGEEEEVEPYDKWEIADLKTELKERGLKTDGRKSILIKRLEQDDSRDGEPF